MAEYVGNSIIKDNIFAVIQNYARKKEIALEMLRYPIHDDELWALTFEAGYDFCVRKYSTSAL